ncbi:TetR/AcrR family transcriptional regulator [Streptomonospora wellingtoniae]|uniref:TetR family transcriptional regulator C-terminal domain-containing protein n=1 Tax=Streptomonospora wellingtoniae TaxID=3075544 RepID=A0ABU2KRA2_9ACTN|nr:TetR family transcriptional regulator C-terminal domain-containing protein [Streptomonospora sp. DSM 45055]MDT0301816.1 TetR family transcriptional regulator C-terminal domain-containing protein [Streptomonospora sp. DSM 45055]
MPRVADHDARRRQIADAVRSVVSTRGLDAATVSRVAREAGFSVGLVQHYFPSKDDLLLFAYERVMARVGARAGDRIAEGESARGSIAAVLHSALRELLPLDEERRSEYRVTQAFAGRSLENPGLAGIAAANSARLRGEIATAVANGTACGEVEPDVDAQTAAARILATCEGLAAQLHREPEAAVGAATLSGAADAILAPVIGAVFTGECRQYAQDRNR